MPGVILAQNPAVGSSRFLTPAEIQSVSITANGIETLWSNGVICTGGSSPNIVFTGQTTSTSLVEMPRIFIHGNGSATATGLMSSSSTRIAVTTGTSSTDFTISGTTTSSSWIVYPGANHNAEERERLHSLQIKRRAEKIRVAKGAIKRALKLMDNIGFGDDARVFLGGNSIEVCHPDSIFKFLLTKRDNSIFDRTISPGYSTPYVLELYTKTEVHVANLCVYMENTPLLDQVMALTMFIKSGDENHILETANWFAVTPDKHLADVICLHNPALTKKVRRINYHH